MLLTPDQTSLGMVELKLKVQTKACVARSRTADLAMLWALKDSLITRWGFSAWHGVNKPNYGSLRRQLWALATQMEISHLIIV